MARCWLIDGKGIATKVKSANLPPSYQIKDSGANRECPSCHYRIDNRDVSEWPGFPAGVKFDPSDGQLMEHLAAKCGLGNAKPHMFIDEFIPTVDRDEGICYSHPEDLPGAKQDGSSVYFFHKITNAYATGQRKRRKIHNQSSLTKEDVRWHKTGKTKPVMESGVQMGFKKIMVLYRISKGSKPNKSNWVMHQYHLGRAEDEIEGEYVVSKIFYQQQKQSDNNDSSLVIERSDPGKIRTSPKTPKMITPNPPRSGKSVYCDDGTDDYALQSSAQEADFVREISLPSSSAPQFKDDVEAQTFLAGESQAVDGNNEDFVREISLPSSRAPQFKDDVEAQTCLAGESQAVDGNNEDFVREISLPSSSAPQFKDDVEAQTCLAGESQAVDGNNEDDLLLCNENFDSYVALGDSGLTDGPFNSFARLTNDIPEVDKNVPCGIAELENIELDTPPDFQLADLQFGSQDSIFDWLDRL